MSQKVLLPHRCLAHVQLSSTINKDLFASRSQSVKQLKTYKSKIQEKDEIYSRCFGRLLYCGMFEFESDSFFILVYNNK
jgi:hypothetical protein